MSCVVRSIDERSALVCRHLLSLDTDTDINSIRQVGGEAFPETLAQSLRAGLEAGREWTLCVDADVLPFPGAVAVLLESAQNTDETTAEVQGLVFDRLFGGWRPAGIHLYRTAHLPLALELIDQIKTEMRPETALLDKMEEQGLPWRQTGLAFGLHDFEQYAQDLYRKCFVHAWKHVHLLPRMLEYWRMRRNDDDFEAALQGLAAGIAHEGRIQLDRNASCFPSLPRINSMADVSPGDILSMLIKEQKFIKSLGFDRAPVWDWAEDFWPDEATEKVLSYGLSRIVERGIRSCTIKGDNHVTARALAREAEAWGLMVVKAGSWWTASEPDIGVPQIELQSDGCLRLYRVGVPIEVFLPHDPEILPVDYSTASSRLLNRMTKADVHECLVYGAGEMAKAFYQEACQAMLGISAFMVSEPLLANHTLFDTQILTPEDALARHEGADLVVASLSFIKPMTRRLLEADVEARHRIWYLHG